VSISSNGQRVVHGIYDVDCIGLGRECPKSSTKPHLRDRDEENADHRNSVGCVDINSGIVFIYLFDGSNNCVTQEVNRAQVLNYKKDTQHI